ncbi:MAG: MerR family transcriptional regulator [Deltaproteobacteria bacterium]|jgi:MerR family transcriptional regulator, light-induced transcriptional regulator|nr:MerR family transcriptional regulator [Deltaproteobacteria bacterium]
MLPTKRQTDFEPRLVETPPAMEMFSNERKRSNQTANGEPQLVPDGLYPMRAVVQLTGLKAETIRAWQRRYKAVVPRRSQGNARRFTMEDVRRLALLREAIRAGHAISEIARLEEDQLLQIVHADTLDPVQPAEKVVEDDSVVYEHTLNRFLQAIDEYDCAEASNVLTNASLYLDTRSFLLFMVAPLMRKIGELWADGDIGVGQEHLATEIVKGTLYTVRKQAGFHLDGPKVIIATPPSCLHEFGANIAGILATHQGWNPVYLGPNIPYEEIQEAAHCVKPQAVLLAVQTILSPDHASEIEQGIMELSTLYNVWVGGPDYLLNQLQLPPSVQRIPSLESLHLFFGDQLNQV